MEKEEKHQENTHENNSESGESNFDSQVFLKIAEELKKDTENIGKKFSDIEKPDENLNRVSETIEKSAAKPSLKEKKSAETKPIVNSESQKVQKKEIIKKPAEKVIQEKPVQPKISIIKNFFVRRPSKKERIMIKEVPKLRKRMNNLRRSFALTADELKSNLGAVNFHQDAEIEFLKKEAGDLNKIIPFLIERIDTLERYNKNIRNSATRRFFKLGGEIKKSQEPLKKIAEEERLLEEKIDSNTLRFNKRLLQEMAESKRMIEEEKYELKNHLLITLAKSIDDLNKKKEEADKKILLEIENLKQKIDEGDKNVNESIVSKIVQLRHKLNESKAELQGEITHELEDLKRNVERRVDRKIERKIEDSQQKIEEDFARFAPQKEIEKVEVRSIKEIRTLPSFENEIPTIERVSKIKPIIVDNFNFADRFIQSSKILKEIPIELDKSKKEKTNKTEKIKIDDFSSLPEMKPLSMDKPMDVYREIEETDRPDSSPHISKFALRKMPKFDSKREMPKFTEKMHQEIKEEIKDNLKPKKIKPLKRKVPSVLYLEEPKVKEVSEKLTEFKKFSKIGEQYFLKEVNVKKENHKKTIENFDLDYETMKKDLAFVRSLLSKVKDE